MNSAIRALDRLQRRTPWLAFPVAVWKKFSDDHAGNLAALVAYYSFASLFPLLLVFVTALDFTFRDVPSLRQHLLNSVFGEFPVLGQYLRSSVHSLRTTGFAFASGLLLALLGGRGAANAAQNALNTVWGVPYVRRPGLPWNQVRSAGLITVMGLGVITTSALSALAAVSNGVLAGWLAHSGIAVLSLLINIGLFWLGFRLATAREITKRELLPGAVLAAVAWQILQLTGTYIVHRELAHSSALYGGFAVVLGLLAWLYLQAELTLYAAEAAVVRARTLWPRGLAAPLTQPDRDAYAMYAKASQRYSGEQIDVHSGPAVPPPPRQPGQT